jgi:hypothetical protein
VKKGQRWRLVAFIGRTTTWGSGRGFGYGGARWRGGGGGVRPRPMGGASAGSGPRSTDGALVHSMGGVPFGQGRGMLMGGPSNCAGFKNTQMGQISSNLNFKLIQTLTSPKMTFPCFKNLK